MYNNNILDSPKIIYLECICWLDTAGITMWARLGIVPWGSMLVMNKRKLGHCLLSLTHGCNKSSKQEITGKSSIPHGARQIKSFSLDHAPACTTWKSQQQCNCCSIGTHGFIDKSYKLATFYCLGGQLKPNDFAD